MPWLSTTISIVRHRIPSKPFSSPNRDDHLRSLTPEPPINSPRSEQWYHGASRSYHHQIRQEGRQSAERQSRGPSVGTKNLRKHSRQPQEMMGPPGREMPTLPNYGIPLQAVCTTGDKVGDIMTCNWVLHCIVNRGRHATSGRPKLPIGPARPAFGICRPFYGSSTS